MLEFIVAMLSCLIAILLVTTSGIPGKEDSVFER